MSKATIILGIEAVAQYTKTNELTSEEWLMNYGGVVDHIDFRTCPNTTPTCKPSPTATAGMIIR